MREQKKKEAKVRCEQAEQMRKMKKQQLQYLPLVLTINFSSHSSAPEDANDCDEKPFCFWCGRILLFYSSNEC